MASPAQSDVFDVLDVVAAFYKIAAMDNSPQTVAERPLRVTYRPLGSLVPSPHNARTHLTRQVEQMVASIREFGFTNPILIDPDGSVIAGHGRLLAAKAMALTEVPAIILEGLGDAQQPALRLDTSAGVRLFKLS